jgi:hypothetical protein
MPASAGTFSRRRIAEAVPTLGPSPTGRRWSVSREGRKGRIARRSLIVFSGGGNVKIPRQQDRSRSAPPIGRRSERAVLRPPGRPRTGQDAAQHGPRKKLDARAGPPRLSSVQPTEKRLHSVKSCVFSVVYGAFAGGIVMDSGGSAPLPLDTLESSLIEKKTCKCWGRRWFHRGRTRFQDPPSSPPRRRSASLGRYCRHHSATWRRACGPLGSPEASSSSIRRRHSASGVSNTTT